MADIDCFISHHDVRWSSEWLDINHKYSMDHFGCVAACVAMCICHRLNRNDNSTNPSKYDVVKYVIDNVLDWNGDMPDSVNINYYGESFSFSCTDALVGDSAYRWPIIHYRKWHTSNGGYWAPHAVLYVNPANDIVYDPAIYYNPEQEIPSTTTVELAASDWGPDISCYWIH